MTVQIRLFSLWLSNRKSEFLGYNVIMTRCSRHTGFNVRPRATKTVLGLRLLRSLQSSDSFGGTRADIKPSMPRAAGSLYPKLSCSNWSDVAVHIWLIFGLIITLKNNRTLLYSQPYSHALNDLIFLVLFYWTKSTHVWPSCHALIDPIISPNLSGTYCACEFGFPPHVWK